MSSARLLLVAPDDEVRRSLVFALEAEGYDVATRADLPERPDIQSRRDCTVLDQRALRPCDREALETCLDVSPVVLLVSRPQPWLTVQVSAVVETPITGGAMVRAVEQALHQAQIPSNPARA